MHTTYTYTYTPSTSSYTGRKPAVGIVGIAKAVEDKNYQLSVKPRLLLGFLYPMKPHHIPKTQAKPAGIYTAKAKPTPNGA